MNHSRLWLRQILRLSHRVALGLAVSMVAGCTEDASNTSRGDSDTRTEPTADRDATPSPTPEGDAAAAQDPLSDGPVSLGPLRQVGIVVEDVQAVSAAWTTVLGIGPWKSVSQTGANVAGEPFSASLAYAVLGEIELELVQVTSGETPLSKLLSDVGEGLYDLGFFVDDLDETVATLVQRGASVLLQEPGEWAYVDSPDAEGIVLKLTKTRDTIEVDASDFEPPAEALQPERIAHVGAWSSDVETVSERWQERFDIGPWVFIPFSATLVSGGPLEASLAFSSLGTTEIELVQLTAGEIPAELLRGDGRGLYEIAFAVADPDVATQRLADRGARVIAQVLGVAALLDAGAGGVAFEIVREE